MRPQFALLVVATADGFIARHPAHAPADWASPEEQAHFLAAVDAADWGILGRRTHEAADRPDRRRIVFSAAARRPEWRRPTQLWLDPAGLAPDDLAALVAPVRPMRQAVILGGTAVHDWFHRAGRIDRVLLTVEPVTFGAGLPLFSGQSGPPEAVLARLGYRAAAERPLNGRGTRLVTFLPG
ncbi:MAG: dihydrofolate reductase family protein [Rhodobacteraceae bacterium]|nr:dihydrofolate reductase family protein [Paracoccaceae bacterium]